MLRNCAAILFVCFDMTACDALTSYLAARPHLIMKRQQAEKEDKADCICAEFISNCALK
jgi:hypothetical protein